MVKLVRTALGGAVGLSFFVLAACGSCSGPQTTSTDAGANMGPSPSQACAAFGAAVCTQLQACSPADLQSSYGDVATCTGRMSLSCSTAFGAAGSQSSAVQTMTCANTVTAETCDEFLDNPQPSACAIPGTFPLGATCGANGQCTSNYCRGIAGTVCGTCTAHVAAGEKCQVDSDCVATLVCNGTTCLAPGAVGATCSVTAPCLRTLTCIQGACAVPLGIGAACSAATDCDGDRGLYCAPSKTCQRIQFAPDTSPCGNVDGGLVGCTAGSTCVNLVNGQGTCHQPAPDNGVCGPTIGCLAPAICTTAARCTLPNPASCH